jgi:hypothetical protein
LVFFPQRRKGSALKNLAGALHNEGGGYTLSVGREVKMKIPGEGALAAEDKVWAFSCKPFIHVA